MRKKVRKAIRKEVREEVRKAIREEVCEEVHKAIRKEVRKIIRWIGISIAASAFAVGLSIDVSYGIVIRDEPAMLMREFSSVCVAREYIRPSIIVRYAVCERAHREVWLARSGEKRKIAVISAILSFWRDARWMCGIKGERGRKNQNWMPY